LGAVRRALAAGGCSQTAFSHPAAVRRQELRGPCGVAGGAAVVSTSTRQATTIAATSRQLSKAIQRTA
jgi:hypothetical protein